MELGAWSVYINNNQGPPEHENWKLIATEYMKQTLSPESASPCEGAARSTQYLDCANRQHNLLKHHISLWVDSQPPHDSSAAASLPLSLSPC
jgi:hypothetical protein